MVADFKTIRGLAEEYAENVKQVLPVDKVFYMVLTQREQLHI